MATNKVFSSTPGVNSAYASTPEVDQKLTQVPRNPEGDGGRGVDLQFEETVGTRESASGAITFDETNALQIADASQTGLDLTGDLTLEGWFKPDNVTLAGTYTLISKDDQDNAKAGYHWWINTGGLGTNATLKFEVSEDNNGDTVDGLTMSSWNITTNFWTHLAVSVDYTNSKMIQYVQGQPVGTATITNTSSINNNDAPFAIGMEAGTNKFFPGKMMDVRVWNDVRTHDEIVTNMRSSSPAGGNLQGHWKLVNNSNDSSGNGNNLNLYGTPTYGTDVPFTNYGTTTRFYPFVGGGVAISEENSDWDTVHDATEGTTVVVDGGAGTVGYYRDIAPLYKYQIFRLFIPPFNTSSLNGANVIGGALFLKGVGAALGPYNLGLVQTTQASSGTLTTDDYDQCGAINDPTEGASREGAMYNTYHGYFDLNSTGYGWINTNGTTQFGVRISNDMEDVAGTGLTNDRYAIIYLRQAGTIEGPMLDVVT